MGSWTASGLSWLPGNQPFEQRVGIFIPTPNLCGRTHMLGCSPAANDAINHAWIVKPLRKPKRSKFRASRLLKRCLEGDAPKGTMEAQIICADAPCPPPPNVPCASPPSVCSSTDDSSVSFAMSFMVRGQACVKCLCSVLL